MLLFNLYGDPALGIHSTAVVSDPDSDGDGIVDLYDNCPDFPNFSQSDADHDSTGDACQAQNNVLLGLGALGLPLTCAGDIDHDGDVDGSDLAVFAADFGRTNCDTEEQCEGDFDDDNDVDGSDLAVFAADFGKTDCGSMPDDLVDVTEITKSWIGSWNFGFTNDVEGVGDLDGDGKDDFIITSVWGFGIVKVDDSGQFVLLGIFPWQDSGEWFQEQGIRFIGVGDFSGVNGAAQEILVSTSQGIGLIYLAKGQVETLALTDFGTVIPGVGGGGWALKIEGRISQHVGDIDGDGFDDIIIRSVWGIGFLKVSGKGEFLSIEQYEWGAQIGKWVLRPNDRLAGIGNFATGAKKEIIFQSNTYLGIFQYANNIEGLENLEMVDGPIMGAGGKSWDLSPFDQVAGLGRLQPGSDLDALVFKSGSDLGVIAWEEFGGFYVIAVHSWGADVGGWTIERRHNIEGIGDINGDGLDEIIIWGANSGIAILKQSENGLTSISHAEQYTMLGNWYLYPDNDVLAIGRFCSPVADGILLKSYDR